MTLSGTISGYADIGNRQATSLINVTVLDEQTYQQNIDEQDKRIQAWIDSKSRSPQPQQPQQSQQNRQYQNGEDIEEDFKIVSSKKISNGAFRHAMVDRYGNKVVMFWGQQYPDGHYLRLSGRIKIDPNWGTSLQYVNIVDDTQPVAQPQQPAPQPQQQMGVHPPSTATPMQLKPEDSDVEASNWYRRMVLAWKYRFGKQS